MTAVRGVLLLAGLACGLYGAVLLWDNPLPVLFHIAIWAGAGVVLHDFAFAPVSAALGFAGTRILPRRYGGPVAIAATCTVVLVLLAIPVYDKPGMRRDNMTVLDRDYHLGLSVSIATVWLVLLCYLVLRRLPVGEDEAVEQQRTDDVESQPPAV